MVVIIVAAMFIVFIVVSLLREQAARRRAAMAKTVAADGVKAQSTAASLFLHPSHTYAKVLNEALVEVGLDDFAKRAFGKVDVLDLPKVGQELHQGEVAWKARVGSRSLTQRVPVDGIIVDVNTAASKGNDWILKVNATHLKDNLANLIQGASIINWLKSARTKFLLNYSGHLVPAMQDGGELVEGFAKYLTDEQWKEFCMEFFNNEKCE